MVKVAEAGSLVIRGQMDTSEIDVGFSKVNNHFETARDKSISFKSDLQRMGSVLSTLTKSLIAMGTAGAGAIVGLAKDSPAVAPALAKMNLEFMKLKFTLGEYLAPAFERVSNLFGQFVNDLNSSDVGKFISGTAKTFVDWLEKTYRFLESVIDKYKEFKRTITGKEEGEEVSLETESKIAGSLLFLGPPLYFLNKITGGGLTKLGKYAFSKVKDLGSDAIKWLLSHQELGFVSGEIASNILGSVLTFNPEGITNKINDFLSRLTGGRITIPQLKFNPYSSQFKGDQGVSFAGNDYITWNDVSYINSQTNRRIQFENIINSL